MAFTARFQKNLAEVIKKLQKPRMTTRMSTRFLHRQTIYSKNGGGL